MYGCCNNEGELAVGSREEASISRGECKEKTVEGRAWRRWRAGEKARDVKEKKSEIWKRRWTGQSFTLVQNWRQRETSPSPDRPTSCQDGRAIAGGSGSVAATAPMSDVVLGQAGGAKNMCGSVGVEVDGVGEKEGCEKRRR